LTNYDELSETMSCLSRLSLMKTENLRSLANNDPRLDTIIGRGGRLLRVMLMEQRWMTQFRKDKRTILVAPEQCA